MPDALDEALIAIDGYAVVGTAALDASLVRYGEVDGPLERPLNVAMNIGPRGVQWRRSPFAAVSHLRNQPVPRASDGVQVPPFAPTT